MSNEVVLECKNLKKSFDRQKGLVDMVMPNRQKSVHAVDDVSFKLHKNESIGVIGESGCGKTTLLMNLMGLQEPTGGEIRFDGKSTSEFNRKDWKKYRRNVQIIFQDPFNSLDPKMTVMETLKEPLKIHNIGEKETKVHDILKKVDLEPPEEYINRHPGRLSGGEKQRVSIARALILEPEIILADEPVSMLDVSTQSSILNLLGRLVDDLGTSMIYISHDLSTVSYICDRINVMYLGRFVEKAPTLELINSPKHPYTKALIDAIPIPDPHHNRERTEMEGAPREPIGLGKGCRFKDRCPERMDICDTKPYLVPVDSNEEHHAACHLYYDHDSYE